MNQHTEPYIRSLDVEPKRVRETPKEDTINFVAMVKDADSTSAKRLQAVVMHMLATMNEAQPEKTTAGKLYVARRWFNERLRAFLDEVAPGKTIPDAKLKLKSSDNEINLLVLDLVEFIDMPRACAFKKRALEKKPDDESIRRSVDERTERLINTASRINALLSLHLGVAMDAALDASKSRDEYLKWKAELDTM